MVAVFTTLRHAPLAALLALAPACLPDDPDFGDGRIEPAAGGGGTSGSGGTLNTGSGGASGKSGSSSSGQGGGGRGGGEGSGGSAGAGGTGEPLCDVTKLISTTAECTDCLHERCCAQLKACDFGTPCEMFEGCLSQYCSGLAGDDLQSCVELSCLQHMTSEALDPWNARVDCINDQCSSECPF